MGNGVVWLEAEKPLHTPDAVASRVEGNPIFPALSSHSNLVLSPLRSECEWPCNLHVSTLTVAIAKTKPKSECLVPYYPLKVGGIQKAYRVGFG